MNAADRCGYGDGHATQAGCSVLAAWFERFDDFGLEAQVEPDGPAPVHVQSKAPTALRAYTP